MTDQKYSIYKLKSNPFRMYPAVNNEEIVWAGFPETKTKIERRVKRAIGMDDSSLVVNVGQYGSGKTHAARFFSKPDVLKSIAGNDYSSPLSIIIDFPVSKMPATDIYTRIVDKLDIDDIRKTVRESQIDVEKVALSVTDNIFIANVLKAFFATDDAQPTLFETNKKDVNILGYLHGTQKNTLDKYSKFGVTRLFNSENDYSDFVAALFSLLTYQKKAYSCVLLWVDEFELIERVTSSGTFSVNNFLRNLMDKTPNNLLLFLNLTLSSSQQADNFTVYLSESMRNRVKELVQLPIPDESKFKQYLYELLNNNLFRNPEDVDDKEKFFPFKEDLVNEIISDLGVAPIRTFNDVFGRLLGEASFDRVEQITLEYYQNMRPELLGVINYGL